MLPEIKPLTGWREKSPAGMSKSASASVPASSGPHAASHPVGRLTGPAVRSTRLASALRLCSSAPHSGAPPARPELTEDAFW